MMSSEKGETSSSIVFPSWPAPKNQNMLIHRFADGGRLKVDPLPGKQLHVQILNKDNVELLSLTTQPILFETDDERCPPYCDMYISWSLDQGIKVILNQSQLLSSTETKSPCRVKILPVQIHECSSLNHPNAFTACKSFVEWRKDKFKVSKAPLSGRKLKTPDELQLDLHDSLIRIQRLLTMIHAGETIWLGTLSTELRALLSWSEDTRSNLHPLLLKVASQADLPLPVYMKTMPEALDSRFTTQIHEYSVCAPPLIEAHADICELADIQTWLISDFLYLKGVGRKNSMWFINECAHTFGPAHYDSSSSIIIQHLTKPHLGGVASITDYLCGIAECVLSLGMWVVVICNQSDSHSLKDLTSSC